MALIAIDFDGVCRHPNGFYDPSESDIPGAAATIKSLLAAGHTVKILTARDKPDHDECYEFLHSNGIHNVDVEGSPTPFEPLSKTSAQWDWLVDDADELIGEPGVIFHTGWLQTKDALRAEGLL